MVCGRDLGLPEGVQDLRSVANWQVLGRHTIKAGEETNHLALSFFTVDIVKVCGDAVPAEIKHVHEFLELVWGELFRDMDLLFLERL